jgi:uncharacterized protein (DUF427 family)
MMWNFKGKGRPEFAVEPSEGQESVWDYPRPPKVEADVRRVLVTTAGARLAATERSLRVLETASPPTFYLPFASVDFTLLQEVPGSSWCEWKGAARYWALVSGSSDRPVAWDYPKPRARFLRLRGHLSFYPGRVDCFVDDRRVEPQPGGFYGGWITPEIVGPFKGDPGTGHW